MRPVSAIVVAMVVAGCGHTVTEDFLDVRPVREVPALANKPCSVYPYRPDETEQFVVCSFHDERPATTM
jgi:hypothetical protein